MNPLIRQHAALVPFNPVEYVWIDFASGPLPTEEQSEEITRRLGALSYTYDTSIADWPLPFEKTCVLLPIVLRGETTPRGAVIMTIERSNKDDLNAVVWGKNKGEKVGPSLELIARGTLNKEFAVAVDPDFMKSVNKTREQCADYGVKVFRTAWRRLMGLAVLNEKAAAVAACTEYAILNAKRLRKGKRPFFEWTTVEIKPRAAAPESQGGTHASPKPHMRRGHVRRLKSGKVVAIKEMIVNKHKMPAEGFVFHDYKATESI